MSVSSVGMSHCPPTIYYILICNTESLPMFNVYTRQKHWSLLYPSPLNVIFYTNVDFIAFKAVQTNKYGLREGFWFLRSAFWKF